MISLIFNTVKLNLIYKILMEKNNNTNLNKLMTLKSDLIDYIMSYNNLIDKSNFIKLSNKKVFKSALSSLYSQQSFCKHLLIKQKLDLKNIFVCILCKKNACLKCLHKCVNDYCISSLCEECYSTNNIFNLCKRCDLDLCKNCVSNKCDCCKDILCGLCSSVLFTCKKCLGRYCNDGC